MFHVLIFFVHSHSNSSFFFFFFSFVFFFSMCKFARRTNLILCTSFY